MKCAVCDAEATYWLCSNACALVYAKKRGRRYCAICSYDARTGRVGRHDTTKICADCHGRSENADWVHKKQEHADPLIEKRLNELVRLKEQQDRPLPERTALTTQIAKLVVEGERLAFVYRDRKGLSHGTRYRWRAYSVRRLAKKLGCAPAIVQRVIASIDGDKNEAHKPGPARRHHQGVLARVARLAPAQQR